MSSKAPCRRSAPNSPISSGEPAKCDARAAGSRSTQLHRLWSLSNRRVPRGNVTTLLEKQQDEISLGEVEPFLRIERVAAAARSNLKTPA